METLQAAVADGIIDSFSHQIVSGRYVVSASKGDKTVEASSGDEDEAALEAISQVAGKQAAKKAESAAAEDA